MPDIFETYKIPVVKREGLYQPLYNPVDYSISKKFFRRHYVQRYYTKGRLHFIWDKLTGKNPQSFQFWVEVTFKNNAQTHDLIEEINQYPEAQLIPTPKKYEF